MPKQTAVEMKTRKLQNIINQKYLIFRDASCHQEVYK